MIPHRATPVEESAPFLELGVLDRYLEQLAVRLHQKLEERPSQRGRAKRLFTVSEAAEYLGRSENAVKLLIHRGKLPVTRIDSKSQIDRQALDRLIDECTYFESEHRT
jgi:excisionase family DNA binding protein